MYRVSQQILDSNLKKNVQTSKEKKRESKTPFKLTNFLIFFQKWHQNRVKLKNQWRNLLSMSPPSRPTWTSPITQRPSLQQSLLPIWRKKRLANKWFDFTNFSNCTFLLKWFCAILLVIFFVFLQCKIR